MSRDELNTLQPFWREVHRRLSSGTPVTRVTVGALTDPQREVLADLLGTERLPASGSTVRLDSLEEAVTAVTGRTLADLLTELIGPISNRRLAARTEAAERAALWSWLDHHGVVVGEPALREWTDQVKRVGILDGSVPRTRRFLEQTLRVIGALPVDGVPLPVFADRVLGDPHGLDDNRPLASMVLRALTCLIGRDLAGDAADRRAVWALFGVDTDALSSTVLVAGLRPESTGIAERLLTACAEQGEAAVLTLAHVRASEAGWHMRSAGSPMGANVVENPSVMAAALRRHGARCPPLICLSGWPSAAAVRLLRLLRDDRVDIRYHGDFDGAGLRIAAHVMARAGARPWRMSTSDYLTALQGRRSGPPVGTVPDAPWDDELGPALRTSGICVPEESVVDLLLADLGGGVDH
jgi:uncharacterized protein (TIGR02679 family)